MVNGMGLEHAHQETLRDLVGWRGVDDGRDLTVDGLQFGIKLDALRTHAALHGPYEQPTKRSNT